MHHQRIREAAPEKETKPLARSKLASATRKSEHPVGMASAMPRIQGALGNRSIQRLLFLNRQGEGENKVTPAVESAIASARGGGRALDSGVRLQMESAFGSNFSAVRVHDGTEADGLARAVNALAFTTGQDVFFRQGAYNTTSSTGRELLAHELTHVVQQGGTLVQTELGVSKPDDPYEREAASVAKSVEHKWGEGIPDQWWRVPSDTGSPSITYGGDPLPKSNEMMRQDDDPEQGNMDAGVTDAGISDASESLPGGVSTPVPPSAAPTPLATRRTLDFITMKRKHIHLFGPDKYGHWWTEIDGSKSYGWWPKYPVGLKETLFGTEGELNGVTSFGGSATRDPHHGDSGEEEFHPILTLPKSDPTVRADIDSFATSYSGEWRWTFGWGQNCHTFQTSLMATVGLVEPP